MDLMVLVPEFLPISFMFLSYLLFCETSVKPFILDIFVIVFVIRQLFCLATVFS
jgi:hypothetical protein